MDINVFIGRNVGELPMSDADWTLYRKRTLAALQPHVDIAVEGVGQNTSDGWGEEDFAFFAGRIRPVVLTHVQQLRAELAELARVFGQDAIAVTIGHTSFVGQDG